MFHKFSEQINFFMLKIMYGGHKHFRNVSGACHKNVWEALVYTVSSVFVNQFSL